MSRELIPLRGDRPAVVTLNGWTVFVSIRDAAYMRELKAWKGRLAAVHPDKFEATVGKRQTRKFREVMRAKVRWQMEEARAYAELGLLPPDGFRGAAGVMERRKRLKGGQG